MRRGCTYLLPEVLGCATSCVQVRGIFHRFSELHTSFSLPDGGILSNRRFRWVIGELLAVKLLGIFYLTSQVPVERLKDFYTSTLHLPRTDIWH